MRERLSGSGPPSMVVDGEHRILVWNDAAERLFGWSAAEAIGRRCQDVIGGRDAFGNIICHAACTPCVVQRSGGDVKPFEMCVAPRTGTGPPRRISTTVRRFEKWVDMVGHTFEAVPAPQAGRRRRGARSV
jgi:PAS domain-containing protein